MAAQPDHKSKPSVVNDDTSGLPAVPDYQVIRRAEVQQLTGLSRSTIYAKMDAKSPYYDPDWPRKVNLGPRSVGWYRHEVIEWVASRSSSTGWEM